jgi:hypothetical protein
MATQIMESVHVEEAAKAEQEAAPGLIEIRFYTASPLDKEDAQRIFDHLWDNGVDVRKVYVSEQKGLPYVGVVYMKSPPTQSISFLPLAVIPLIAFGMVAALIGIGVFKIESITQNLGKIMLIGFGGTIILAALLRKPIERVATKYAGG